MRKNKLIEILSKIKGNPEITIWNGIVGDVMPIRDLTPTRLVKYSLSGMMKMCRYERCRDTNDASYQLTEDEIVEIKEAYRKYHHWEINEYVTDKDVKSGDWIQKIVYTIDAKKTGKKYFDSFGEISY